jgi:hypothetical protein
MMTHFLQHETPGLFKEKYRPQLFGCQQLVYELLQQTTSEKLNQDYKIKIEANATISECSLHKLL